MADKTAILSVGIDVGTSTTQVVFSKLQMDNAGGYFSVPRVAIVDKEVVYKSEVYMTPLKTDVLIDTDALRDIVAAEFRKAGYRPEDTDSGAVIITGESARKENSDAVLKSLSDFAGDFVVSAAGPDMESLIAGKGSGAWQYSMDHHCRVANLDIGGGTTGLAILKEGKVVQIEDEPTGGTHLTLVLSGNYHVSFEEAEAIKQDYKRHREILPVVRPVVEKMATIVSRYVDKAHTDTIYLCGGTCCLTGIEDIFQKVTGIRTIKPANPFLVTPTGIAMNCTLE